MPISGNFVDTDRIFQKLDELLAEGVGNPELTHSKSAILQISGPQILIPKTEDRRIQEVWVANNTIGNITLIIDVGAGMTIPVVVASGSTWQSRIDGRTSINIEGSGEVQTIVRSDQEILYEIGEELEMPIPVLVKLIIGTGAKFSNELKPYYDVTSGHFEDNFSHFLDSDEGISGHKLIILDSFQPGKEIVFDVVSSGAGFDLAYPISFQWLSINRLFELIGTIGADIINPESTEVDSAIVGFLSQKGWVGDVVGGKIKLTPTMTNFVGRFAARSTVTDAYDTCVVTSYQKNNDPYQGGTFTLGGF